MQIIPSSIISLEEFDKLTGTTDGIDIGDVIRPTESGLKEFLNLWVLRIDNLLSRIKEGSPLWDKYTTERLFTYSEYRQLFMSIDEIDYRRYPAHYHLGISNKHSLRDFLSEYEENFDDYLKVLGYCIGQRQGSGLAFFFERLIYKLPVKALDYHCYVPAATGAGKSTLLRQMIYKLQRMSRSKGNGHSMSIVLIEPHGELCHEVMTSYLNAEDMERVVLIDPTIGGDKLPVINPLQIRYSSEEEVVNHAQGIVDSLQDVIGSELSTNMYSVFVACVSILIKRKGSSMVDIIDFMNGEPELVKLGAASKDPIQKRIFTDFDKKYKQQKAALASRLERLLLFPSVRKMLEGDSTIDLKEVIDNGKVVICNMSQQKLGEEGASAMGRMIVAMIKHYALSRGRHKMPTYLFVDECQRFVSGSFVKILQQARKYKLHVILANQNIEMLGIIGEDIISNCAVKIVGYNGSSKTLTTMAKSMAVDATLLQGLKDFRFCLKTRDGEAVIVKPSNVLATDSSYSMTEEQERKLEQYQIDRYYVDKSDEPIEQDLPKKDRYEL